MPINRRQKGRVGPMPRATPAMPADRTVRISGAAHYARGYATLCGWPVTGDTPGSGERADCAACMDAKQQERS